ncbi:hypothetical protein GGR56DRAFT_674805 [Xylariaceae sp. FL0804]|nr:hypothetical protein GGR56DRAFT_674805 [Xylariaceae sp. FL0804]
MCRRVDATYPCGHVKSRLEPCGRARLAANLPSLRRRSTPTCDRLLVTCEPPDLEDGCGRACLTRPWQCGGGCGSARKQVGWRCADCGRVRDRYCRIWRPCRCPGTAGSGAKGAGTAAAAMHGPGRCGGAALGGAGDYADADVDVDGGDAVCDRCKQTCMSRAGAQAAGRGRLEPIREM